jgi:hypothetical protein
MVTNGRDRQIEALLRDVQRGVREILRRMAADEGANSKGRAGGGKFGAGNAIARKPKTVAEVFAKVFAENARKASKAANSPPRVPRKPDDD